VEAAQRSAIAEEALRYFAALYKIEQEARDRQLTAAERQLLRQEYAKPIVEALRKWLLYRRGQVSEGSATAKAIAYSLGRWEALVRYIDDGDLSIDNNHLENKIRPVALGRSYVRLRIMRGSRSAASGSDLVSRRAGGRSRQACRA
jgi:transposase